MTGFRIITGASPVTTASAPAPAMERPQAVLPPRLPQSANDVRSVHLVDRLARALDVDNVRYCQWKGALKRNRWKSGEGDIDLLVDRASADAFTRVMARLGFKLALAPPRTRVPGVQSYLGVEPTNEHLVHVHAHYRLIVGDPRRALFHPGGENAVLDSAESGLTFRTPAPAFEYILFVLQQTLRHGPFGAPDWLPVIQLELRELADRVDHAVVRDVLQRHFPEIDAASFESCEESLALSSSRITQLLARERLCRLMDAAAVKPDLATAIAAGLEKPRRLIELLRGVDARRGKHLASGGAVIALVGTDGSGKTTCAVHLARWLGKELRSARVHLGRPPRSFATLVVGGALKLSRTIGQKLGRPEGSVTAHLELLRYVCSARDRYLLHALVRRFASAGGIAICDRFPVPPTFALVGPSRLQGRALAARSGFASWLRRREAFFYTGMLAPDVIFLLEVDAETAVRRKQDEPEGYVRARAELMQESDWSGVSVHVIDARRPLIEVLAEMRQRIWKAL